MINNDYDDNISFIMLWCMIYDIYDVINVTIGSYIIPIILCNQWRIKSYILPIGFWKDPSSVAGFWSLKKGRRDKLCSLMIYRIDDSVNCSCGGEDAKQFGFHLIWLILLCLVVPEYLSSSIPASHLEHNSPTKFQIRQTSMAPWKIRNFQVPLLHLAGFWSHRVHHLTRGESGELQRWRKSCREDVAPRWRDVGQKHQGISRTGWTASRDIWEAKGLARLGESESDCMLHFPMPGQGVSEPMDAQNPDLGTCGCSKYIIRYLD